MPKPHSPAFDPRDVAETNATTYPPAFREANSHRWNRRLGEHAGLRNFGVNLVRLEPGSESSMRHWHAKQDEFIYVLEGNVTLVTDAGRQVLGPGMCAGFPARSGDGHQLVNRSASEVVYLEVGARLPGDEGSYPDDDLKAVFAYLQTLPPTRNKVPDPLPPAGVR